ncbi:MAG TPA: DUF748 domain-containing protein [Candidatus Binataceae bacterium]|nr:DUF748 domain-containing protein [Candidatus Binataceae bacterium]
MIGKLKAFASSVWAQTFGRGSFGGRRWMRRSFITVVVVVLVFGLVGFVGVPVITQYVVVGRVAQSLHRPLSIERVRFNPYRLLLNIEKMHIGDRDAPDPFVDIGHIRVKVSWTSLLRLAPVVKEVVVYHPAIHIVRTAEQHFNFSDLLESSGPPPAPMPSQPAKPQRFAISNIQIHQGQIHFEDKVLNQRHAVEHLELDVPFIANLPADVDTFVQPLLQMVVDGSPLRIAGKAKPFAVPPESVIDLNFHNLGLPLYLGYVPEKLPLRVPQGTFSSLLHVHFVSAASGPEIRVSGEMAIDQLDVRDAANAPLAAFKHLSVVLDEIKPLKSVTHLGKIYLDGLTVHVVRNADGRINLASLASGAPPATGPPQAAPSPAAANASAVSPSAMPSPAAANLAAARPSAVPSSVSSAVPSSTSAPTFAPTPAKTSAAASAASTALPTTATIATSAATPTPAAVSAQLTANAPPAAAATPQAPAAAASPASADFALAALELTNGAVLITDNSVAPPAALTLGNLHVVLKDLRTVGQKAPAPYEFGTTLSGGGSIVIRGALDLAQSQATTDVTLDTIDIPALQGFAKQFLAATVASGKLTTHAAIQTFFAPGKFNVHTAPASVALDNFDLRAPGESQSPIGWNKLSASIGAVDLASHRATVSEVRFEGLQVFVRRDRNGQLSLASLMRGAATPEAKPTTAVPRRSRASSRRSEKKAPEKKSTAEKSAAATLPAEKKAPTQTPPSARERLAASTARERRSRRTAKTRARLPAAAPTPSPGQWHYQVASVALEKTEIRVEDEAMPQKVAVAVAPLNLHLKNISDDLTKPIALDLDGILNRKGSFKVAGTVTPTPLKVNLRIAIRRLDLAPFDPYVTSHLNTKISSAALTMNGEVGVADERARKEMRVSYRGSAAVVSVKMLDKVTNESFLRWSSFSANGIDFLMGAGPPKLHVAALDLSDFYARIILNSDGRLNLRDVTASPEEAGVSLTRAHGAPGSTAPAPTPAPTPLPTPTAAAAAATPAAAPSPAPLPANLEIGGINLSGGQVNYTDNFIKPNYSADLTQIKGKVGTFGTSSTTPADVELDGQVNGSSPLTISGQVNPLTPLAFVDIKAKAENVELTDLSAYSAKYTGYPIVKGALTVDVHYLLDQQKLTAENHILIDQLTFGDKVESPNALNLPIRLAVALLKNPQGQIDLRIPVSGSLSDPQFSIGAVLVHVVVNLIMKAVTSPFSLIASAVNGVAGGGAGGGQDLNYVVFAPGWANVTASEMKKLDTVAKALQERPALKLVITGRIDPKIDREGLPAALVEQSVAKQKVLDNDQNPANVDLASVQVTPDEYDKYLKRAYKAAKFDKPRDLLGLNKSLDPDAMKKLMIANTKVTDADLKQLAEDRANAVQKALSGKIDPGRITIAAPKLNADGIKDGGKATRAELSVE